MKMKLPKLVYEIITLLESAHFVAYVVGGACRDYLLGIEPKDYDITTSASVNEMLIIFKNYKIIETGLKHDTITIHKNNLDIEITSFRGEKNNIEDDLKLRDYTINSLAYHPRSGMIDITNGINDLENKVIKITENNASLIETDPLRILRGIRLAYKYGFSIDKISEKTFFDYKDRLVDISPERLREELNQIIVCNYASDAFLKYLQIFETIIPELSPMVHFDQNNYYHIYDVYIHTLKVMDGVKRDKITRLAALFHDIGKPTTYTVDNEGNGHFYGHQEKSVEIAKKIMLRLKYPNKEIDAVLLLIRFHDYQLSNSKKNVRKFLSKFGSEYLNELLDLKQADILAQSHDYIYRIDDLMAVKKTIDEVIMSALCFSIKDLNINGKNIIELGIPQGPIIKQILNDLLTKVMSEELENQYDNLLEFTKNNYL
ncbi:MAG: CCA tRNA nucleotidyltransferase [Candidatus Izemoplasmatales bacterium]